MSEGLADFKRCLDVAVTDIPDVPAFNAKMTKGIYGMFLTL